MHLAGEHAPASDCDLYLAANASDRQQRFELPSPPAGQRWRKAIDTARQSPWEIAEEGREPLARGRTVGVGPHACVVLISSSRGG